MPSRSLSTTNCKSRRTCLDVLAAAAAAVTVAQLLTAFLPHLHTFLHTPSSSSFATYLSPPLFFFAHTSPALRIHTICFQISKISAFNCPPTCSLAATFCHATSFLLTHRALLSLLFTDNTTRGRYVLIAACCLCVAPPAVHLNNLQQSGRVDQLFGWFGV